MIKSKRLWRVGFIMENFTNGNTTCIHNLSDEQIINRYSLSLSLGGIGSLVIGLSGIFLNIIAILIMVTSELKKSFFYWLLICLVLCDTSFLVICVSEAFRNHIGSHPIHDYIFAVFLFPFRSMVMLGSIYFTIGLSIERYNALLNPISHRNPRCMVNKTEVFWLHRKRLLKYLLPILFVSVIFYISRFFEVEVITEEIECTGKRDISNSSIRYKLEISDLRKNGTYILWYINVSNLLLTCVIPLVSILYLNCKVYIALRNYMKKKLSMPILSTNEDIKHNQRLHGLQSEKIQQTFTLFGIIAVFIICHALRVIMNVKELFDLENIKQSLALGCNPWSYSFMVMVPISETLLQINCSVNFFIYCGLNQRYKKVFFKYLRSGLRSYRPSKTTIIRQNGPLCEQETKKMTTNTCEWCNIGYNEFISNCVFN